MLAGELKGLLVRIPDDALILVDEVHSGFEEAVTVLPYRVAVWWRDDGEGHGAFEIVPPDEEEFVASLQSVQTAIIFSRRELVGMHSWDASVVALVEDVGE